jgi:aspartate racemase
MKKIGIVGGLGWQSTVHYYSELCRRGERWHLARNLPGLPSTPEISIESLDLAKAVAWLGSDENEESWRRFDEYHNSALKRLEASGADFAIIASNTPHHRFETIVQGIRIPVISILDAVAKESARIGAMQVVILGTAHTMNSPRFREAFARHGVTAAGPRDEALRSATVELIRDLQIGKLDGASERLRGFAKRLFEAEFGGQRAVCLACTELPLAFETVKALGNFEDKGILYINASIVHIDAAFKFAVEG